MAIGLRTDLMSAFKTSADRAWYLSAYLHFYGSQVVPVSVLNALGATPRGRGTYCWTDGVSEIWIRGDFSERPGPWAIQGTVNISQANFTVSSPAWAYDPHYDYSQKLDHEVAHLHPSPSEKWSMEECPDQALAFLWLGVSETFASFIDRMRSVDGSIPVPDSPDDP